jgi:predicted dehydrogenase
MVAEATPELAFDAARRYGFRRHARDWRELVEDPAVHVVDISVPSALHREIAMAAIGAGKHIYCEKPIGLSGAEAAEIATAANAAGIKSLTGYTYLRNPLVGLARRLIEQGELGRIVQFRGVHNEDYLSDIGAPFTWRCDPETAGKAGALGDLGSHILSIALHLAGDIQAVSGNTRIVTAERPVARGAAQYRKVGNDDVALALLNFSNGAVGTIEASRIATGSKMGISYEIAGTEGALRFDGERGNELQYYSNRDPQDRRGFRRIYGNAEHQPYGNLSPGPGHGFSFNDHKTIEILELMELVAADRLPLSNLKTGAAIGRVLDAILDSAERRDWVELFQR